MYVSRYIHTRIVIRKRITIHIHPDVCASHHTNITIYILRAPPEALRFAAQRTAAHRGPAHRDSEAGPPFGCGLRRARPERAIEGREGGGLGASAAGPAHWRTDGSFGPGPSRAAPEERAGFRVAARAARQRPTVCSAARAGPRGVVLSSAAAPSPSAAAAPL